MPLLKIDLSWMLICLLLIPMTIKANDRLEQSKAYINQAQEYLESKQYEAAIDAFQKANQIYPDLQNFIMISSLYSRLNRCQEGLASWDNTIARCQACDDREMLLQKKAKLQDKCTIAVQFTSTPTGVMISQLGLNLGLTPFKKTFILGNISIEASKPGFETKYMDLSIFGEDQQQTQNIHISLKPLRTELIQSISIDHREPTLPLEVQKKSKVPSVVLATASVAALVASVYFRSEATGILESSTRGYAFAELRGLTESRQEKLFNEKTKEGRRDEIYSWTFFGTGILLATSAFLTFKF